MNFTKRFEGSYYTTLSSGHTLNIQSYSQYTGELSQDDSGNKWVLSLDAELDWGGEHTTKFKTKREAVAYAEANYK
jgi:hypothetical protein